MRFCASPRKGRLLTVHREHLYRKHCKVHCQRCKQVFRKQSELAAHAMRPESCRLREGNGPADISAQQELQLKSKKYASRYQSEEEKWREVYRLLFPGEHIPSPCEPTHNTPGIT